MSITQDLLSKIYFGLLTAVLSALVTLGAGMLVWREQFVRLVVIVETLEQKLTEHDSVSRSRMATSEHQHDNINKRFTDVERRLDQLEYRLSVRK